MTDTNQRDTEKIMQLRYEIPDTFWSLFRSVNREIYMESLLVINEEYQYSNYFLTKEICVQVLSDMNAQKQVLLQREENETDFDMLETTASRILRWLLKTGWLKKIEDYSTMTTNIVIPDYAAVFIEAFERLTSEELEETELYIQNVYATLFSFQNNSRVNLNMLRTALINTRKLNKALQDMLHNMDKFFERLLDQESYGELILMHDRTLDRTTTGKGLVSENTLSDIRKLNLRNGCNIRTIHNVPTLDEALLHAKGKIMINLDQADLYFDQIYELMKKTGTTKQIIMKGRKPVAEVKKQFGDYLEDVIYMPIVDLDASGAEKHIEAFIKDMSPVAFELLFVKDTNLLPKKLATTLNGRSLIWYNTLWDTMAGGHDDDMSLQNPDSGYGYLIDTLGCRIIQTDRPAYLLDYLRKRKLHD